MRILRVSMWVVSLALIACGPVASEPEDAGTILVDSGVATVDSGVPLVDGGHTEFDAGTSVSDAGSDGGVRNRDAGAFECPLGEGLGATLHIRAMAANLSSGNLQSYDPDNGKRIMQGLHPDIVMIQEFNIGQNTDSDISNLANALNTGSDAGMYWARGAPAQIPNGVISRWPIRESGDWVDPRVDNRAFTWAHVDLPGPRDLWVVSLHLLTKSASERNLEATALVAKLDTFVPATDFLLIGGDFNTDSHTEAVISTLGARVVTTGTQPGDNVGTQGTNAGRSKPYDWVLASKCLNTLTVPVQVGLKTFANGLVVDTRVFTPLGDIAPAQYGDSASSNMQHMGVVKDFAFEP